MAKHQTEFEPVGKILRAKRIDVIKVSLRAMAKTLNITPAHLSDIEKGRRTPSEELLQRIQEHYQVSEGLLRSGWSKLDAVIQRVGTQNPETAERASAFMAAAETLSPAEWDRLIRQARRMGTGRGGQEK